MPASLAAVSVAAITLHESKPPPPSAAHARQPRRRPSAGPAPHPVAAQSNITRARSMLCGRHAPSHAGQGNTLGASCCRTCRRLCAKYGRPLEVPCCRTRRRRRARNRLRERDATRRRRAVPTAAPRTRAPPAPATARPPPPPPTEIRRIYEADRRATPARPRAPKPSRWNDQRPRSRPPPPGAAPSPRRDRPQSVTEPDEIRPSFFFIVWSSWGKIKNLISVYSI